MVGLEAVGWRFNGSTLVFLYDEKRRARLGWGL